MNKQKAFFSLEYALLLAIIITALLAMSVYFRQALCGRWRQAGDAFGQGRQYEPGWTQITEP